MIETSRPPIESTVNPRKLGSRFSNLSFNERSLMLAQFRSLVPVELQNYYLSLLNRLLSTEESIKFSDEIIKTGFSEDEVPHILRSEGFQYILGITQDAPEQLRTTNTFQLGVLLSQQPSEKVTQNKARVTVTTKDKDLCYLAEPRLKDALKKDGCLAMTTEAHSPVIEFKYNGKPARLCIGTFSTDYSTFVAGNWYAPTNISDVRDLVHIYDSGINRVVVPGIDWTLLRPVRGSKQAQVNAKQLVGLAILLANKLPALFEDADPYIMESVELFRSNYRLTHFEGFPDQKDEDIF